MGRGICQHIRQGFHLKERTLIRTYTSTRPVRESEEDGTFQFIVNTYPPRDDQPGGAMSNVLDCIPLNEEIAVRGLTDW